jgi:hypothetical protein
MPEEQTLVCRRDDPIEKRPTLLLTARWGSRRRRVRLLREIEGAGPPENARAFVPGSRALCIGELGLDVVAIVVALHREHPVRMVLSHGAFGRKLGAAVIRYFSFDQQVARPTRFAVHSVKVVVFNCAGKLPFVGLGLSMRISGEVRGPIAVVLSPRSRSPRQEHKRANSHD